MTTTTEGPARYYRPVCVLTAVGFVGGPSGYMEVGEDENDLGPLIVEREKDEHTT